MSDAYDLDRFLKAQDSVLTQVRSELRAGRKRTHWMWFIFPQLAGLGRSDTAVYYAIPSLEHARKYLAHPALGPRLIECTAIVNAVADRSAHDIFGAPDDRKFHSSMTLFSLAEPQESSFSDAMKKYFDGTLDRSTTEKLDLR